MSMQDEELAEAPPLPFDPTLENYAKMQQEKTRRMIERDAVGIRERSKTLAGFVKEAWNVLEPANPYVHGWHIDVICACLEDVTAGRILRLLINVPPGMMKSLLVSVIWPAWEWGPAHLPHMRYLASSYSENFTKRDNRRMRDLVASDWYKALWPHVKLARFGETSFENTKTGSRDARPFQSLTGGRGDRVLIDDPHSVETAESEPERERTLRIFRESVPSRMLDPQKSAIVIIMQRLHERDISGYVKAQPDRMGYHTLILPMEFEPDRVSESSIGLVDQRKRFGELLFPERFPRDVVERDKAAMGSHAVAGQFQQRPSPRGGGMFKREWFEIVTAVPRGKAIKRSIRWWDIAATAKSSTSPNPDYTVGLLMVQSYDGVFYIADVVRMRGSDLEVERAIRNTASLDGSMWPLTWQTIPQDPGSAGKFVANSLIRKLAGYRARKAKEDQGKEMRAEPFAAQCEAGNVKIAKAPWNEMFLEELTSFPSGAHDDQVDAASGAFRELTTRVEMRVGAIKGLC